MVVKMFPTAPGVGMIAHWSSPSTCRSPEPEPSHAPRTCHGWRLERDQVFLFQGGAKLSTHCKSIDSSKALSTEPRASLLPQRSPASQICFQSEAADEPGNAFGNFGDFLFVTAIGSPERRIMSGRNSRMRWICSCGFRPSLAAMCPSHGPRPQSGAWRLSAVICLTTPPTIICSPPPAELVEM